MVPQWPEEIETLLERLSARQGPSAGRGLHVPEEIKHLDTAQLAELERCFRAWAEASPRRDVRLSRRRVLGVFLIIRYAAAKLGEVLSLDLARSLRPGREAGTVAPVGESETPGCGLVLGLAPVDDPSAASRDIREVQLPEEICRELADLAAEPELHRLATEGGGILALDPGHVRRKFYERAREAGLAKELGSPAVIRRSRAIELLRQGLPLPMVQRMLGHATPNLAAGYVGFSSEEMRRTVRFTLERESRRRTSARNAFFGKVQAIRRGDTQARVQLATLGGQHVSAVITLESLERMGLVEGGFASAEIKAPLVLVVPGEAEPRAGVANRLRGRISRITPGKLSSEVVVELADGSEVCGMLGRQELDAAGLREGDTAWALCSEFAVVLHVE